MPPGFRARTAERRGSWHKSTNSSKKSCAGALGSAFPGRRSATHPSARELSPLRQEPLTAEFVKETLYEIMPKKAVERFEQKDGADFAYTLEGKGRFRVNVMRQLNGMGAVMRAIPSKALTLDELDMPTPCGSSAAPITDSSW